MSPNYDEGLRGRDHPGYACVGRFEPRDAKHIIKRLDEEHIPVEVDAPEEINPPPRYYSRHHWLFIHVPAQYLEMAEAIVLEDFQV